MTDGTPAPQPDDFETALRATLARNDEMAQRRAAAEAEMDRAQAEHAEERERREQEQAAARQARHAQLVEHLQALAARLKESSPESFVVRLGWTPSGEEFIARMSTRKMRPARTLFVELDRDDDEVLARWSGDLGSSLELWRLLEVQPSTLTELVLQIADQQLWEARTSPPPFPGARS